MNYSELIKSVSKDTNIPKEYVKEICDSMFDVISSAISVGEDVRITHFGKFHFKKMNPHRMYSFKEGKVVELPARSKLAFKVGDTLRDRMKANGSS